MYSLLNVYSVHKKLIKNRSGCAEICPWGSNVVTIKNNDATEFVLLSVEADMS